MDKICESAIRVRYEETDQMKVVYHSNYLVWFEIGRTDFIRQIIGLSYASLEEKGVLFPVIEAWCKYKVPARYDDELIVQTTVKEVKGVQLTFAYKIIRREDGELLAKGETEHVFTSPELKPVNLRRKFPELYKSLQEAIYPAPEKISS
jgi:acyl-CoA thioester hydrolase